MAARRVLGLDSIVEVSRRGVRWRLDLAEGIDFAIYLLGSFESTTVDAYSRFAELGTVALDLGANIGAHTMHLARAVGPKGLVVAFEPTDYAFSKLTANIALNPTLAPRIKTCQLMLLENEIASVPEAICSSWPLKTEEGLHPGHFGKLMAAHSARGTTLDRAIAELLPGNPRISLIKMDVDGYECRLLRGAKQTLNKHRPLIVMEMSPYVLEEMQNSVEELVALLVECGYGLRDLSARRSLPLEGRALRSMIPWGAGINVLAVPEDVWRRNAPGR